MKMKMKMKMIAMLMMLTLCVQAQQVKVAGIRYFAGVPSGVPALSGGEVALDTTTGYLYVWQRDAEAWGRTNTVDRLAGLVAPAYTPRDKQSVFVVTDADSLYQYRSGAWRHLNAVGATGGVADGDREDITVSAGGTAWTIDNGVVSTTKLATSAVTAIKLATGAVSMSKIATTGAVNGSLIRYNGSAWVPGLPDGSVNGYTTLNNFGYGLSGSNVFDWRFDSLASFGVELAPNDNSHYYRMSSGNDVWKYGDSQYLMNATGAGVYQNGSMVRVRAWEVALTARRIMLNCDTIQLGGLSYTYPSTHGVGTVLWNNGSGNLAWVTAVLAEVDGSVTNELQSLSAGANTLTLSNGGGTVTVDTDPASDLTTSTAFVGDLSGLYNSVQIVANAVNSNELASTSVVPGSYSSADIIVDTDGRITSAVNGSAGSGSNSVGRMVSDSVVVWNEYPCSYTGLGWETTVWGLGSQGQIAPEVGRPGIGTLTVSATSVAGSMFSWGNVNQGVALPGAGVRFRASIQLPSLLLTADSIVARVGFFPRTANMNKGRQGSYFDIRTDGSGAYIVYAVTAVNAAATLTNITSSVGSLAGWITFEIRYNSATSVSFYANNTLVSTHTANIDPGTVNRLYPAVCAGRTGSGVTGMNTMKVDYILFVTPSSRL